MELLGHSVVKLSFLLGKVKLFSKWWYEFMFSIENVNPCHTHPTQYFILSDIFIFSSLILVNLCL